jgi:hypothetical protein
VCCCRGGTSPDTGLVACMKSMHAVWCKRKHHRKLQIVKRTYILQLLLLPLSNECQLQAIHVRLWLPCDEVKCKRHCNPLINAYYRSSRQGKAKGSYVEWNAGHKLCPKAPCACSTGTLVKSHGPNLACYMCS